MADLAAGDRIVSSGLKHPFTVRAAASADTTPGAGAVVDLTGATVSFNTVQSAATVTVWGVFDMQCTSASAGNNSTGHCNIDGTDQTSQAVGSVTTVNQRGTVTQIWTATLSGSGPHTIKLQGGNPAAGVTVFRGTHTSITVQVNDF